MENELGVLADTTEQIEKVGDHLRKMAVSVIGERIAEALFPLRVPRSHFHPAPIGWRCDYCDTTQAADAKGCERCGAPR